MIEIRISHYDGRSEKAVSKDRKVGYYGKMVAKGI